MIGGAGSGNRGGPQVFFVDLARTKALLEAEETRTPRLSDADVARAQAITDGTARSLWRASRIATRIVLERVAGERFRGVPFRIEAGGRPALSDGPHFSIAHSGDAAIIAVTEEMPVGVDIEPKGRSIKVSADRRLRLVRAAERFGPSETLSAASDTDVLAAWVRLEAVAKALGTGIGRLLTEEGVIGGAAPPGIETSDRGGLAVRSLSVHDDYAAAIAAEWLPNELAVATFPVATLKGFLDP